MKMLITLAWRNIWRNKRRSLISMASVLFAVFFAVAANSFEMGSYELMINNMVKLSTGYIQVQDVLYDDEPSIDNAMIFDDELRDQLSLFDHQISYVLPRIQSFALAATDNNTRGTMVMGVIPAQENKINNLESNLVKGIFISESDSGIMLGEGLAGILRVNVGDTLVLIGQGFQGMSAAGLFEIQGIVRLPLPDMNNNTIYMALETAQWFYGLEDRITSLIIMPENPRRTERLAAGIRESIDGEWYAVITWRHMLRDLLQIMEVDQAGNQLIIYILYVVIGFGLFATILTMILERLKEFGMLISLGMKRYQLALVCLFETVFMSFLGALAGIAVSFPIMLYFNLYPVMLTGEIADLIIDYGFAPILPTSIDPTIFIKQAVSIFVLSLLIGLYPVVKVFKLQIINVTKH